MLSQERQKLAGSLLYGIQTGKIDLDPNKTFNDYINEMLGKLENRKIKRVVKNLGCSEDLLRELFRKGVTETNISEYGVFDELKESCDREKSREFFEAEHGESYSDSYLSMYIDKYLRYFLLHNGEDQFVEIDHEEVLNEEYKTKEYKQIDVILTEEDIKDTKIVTTVPTAQLSVWYKEGGALASIIESDAFAYVDGHL